MQDLLGSVEGVTKSPRGCRRAWLLGLDCPNAHQSGTKTSVFLLGMWGLLKKDRKLSTMWKGGKEERDLMLSLIASAARRTTPFFTNLRYPFLAPFC